MIQKTSDIIVIGGGIIGLSVAWQLARHGATVTLLERDQVARQSSWAAAGMLSPFGENHAAGPLLDFGVASLHLYPEFVQMLAEDHADPPGLNGPGMIRLVMSENEIADRKHSASLALQNGFQSDWLTREEVIQAEPSVGSECLGGVLSTSEVHIDPRMLCDSIKTAGVNRGVRIMPFSEACSFELANGAVAGVRCRGSVLRAEKYIVAAGAWSGKFAQELGWDIPIFPRKGQMIKVAMTDGTLPFRHTLYTHSLYLVPRDGGVVIGATQENVGFATTLTDDAVGLLLEGAVRIVPSLKNPRIIESWMGFRPATDDGLPVIGALSNHPNVYFATGHLRNGILLTPITAKSVVDEMLNDASVIPIQFRPDRFSKVNS